MSGEVSTTTIRRARWLAQQLNETADMLEAGHDVPGARRVLPMLLAYGGAKHTERLIRMVFVSGLQAGAALRLTELLERRDLGGALNAGELERVAELDGVRARIEAGEPYDDAGTPFERDALLLKAAWDEDRARLGSKSKFHNAYLAAASAEDCAAVAREHLALLFPAVAAKLGDSDMIAALDAFSRAGGGAKRALGTATKWEELNAILVRAGMPSVAGATIETDFKHWNAGRMLDEQ